MKILTFDIEEWFHILDNDKTKGPAEWVNFESRIHNNMNVIFELLENSKKSVENLAHSFSHIHNVN